MKTIKIELPEDELFRLMAYTKADNYSMDDLNYRTLEEMAGYLVSLMTQPDLTPFTDDKRIMGVYNKEYNRLKSKNQKL